MVIKANKFIGPESFSPRQLPLRSLDIPQQDVVHLWHLDFDRLSNPLPAGIDSRSEAHSMARQRATRRFYLRLLLGAYLGRAGKDIHIIRRIRGKPELDRAVTKGKLDFSVARSNSCYLIGISSGAAIGVDLEIAARQSGQPLALARRYFSKPETVALAALDEKELQRAFMHTWACKEAIIKASGMGIANQLCRFSVDIDPGNPPSVLTMQDDEPSAWQLAMAAPVHSAIAAVAVRQKRVHLEGFSLS